MCEEEETHTRVVFIVVACGARNFCYICSFETKQKDSFLRNVTGGWLSSPYDFSQKSR